MSNAINPDRKLHDFSPFKYPSFYSGLSNIVSFFFVVQMKIVPGKGLARSVDDAE